jgi:hypothetical protein
MIVSFDPVMNWYIVSSEGVSHDTKSKVLGPRPDEPFDKNQNTGTYKVYYSLSLKGWTCPCKSFRYSNYKTPCKHIKAVENYREKLKAIIS